MQLFGLFCSRRRKGWVLTVLMMFCVASLGKDGFGNVDVTKLSLVG